MGEQQHFHPKGKMPSKFTIELQKGLRATLPFEDKRDFEEAKRGFVAAPPYKQIMAEAGNVAWDMGSYEFLLQGDDFDSIHPSLERQAILNMATRLCPAGFGKCAASIWRTSVSSRAIPAWIVLDPLTAEETAKAALDFINEKLGKRPVVAVVHSHSLRNKRGKGTIGATRILC
jgi:alkyl sulfatase BDS1-like metallo-beta-lactamase superfamily hydrolase